MAVILDMQLQYDGTIPKHKEANTITQNGAWNRIHANVWLKWLLLKHWCAYNLEKDRFIDFFPLCSFGQIWTGWKIGDRSYPPSEQLCQQWTKGRNTIFLIEIHLQNQTQFKKIDMWKFFLKKVLHI